MKRVLSVFAAAVLTPLALAQPYYRGEVEFAIDSTFGAAPAQNGLTLAGRLEAEYDLDFSNLDFNDLDLGGFSPVAFNLMLDSSVRVGQAVTTDPGLTELYAATTYGDLDFSTGVERLPLETARLSVPYSVETVGVRGVRRGVPGVRAVLYRDDWRFRGAVFYRDVAGQDFVKKVAPLLSVRHAFDGFDLEAHVLYQNGLVTGLGGSGLVGSVVIYGEAWLLTDPLEGRGALGLNGNLLNGTWTLEAAYLTPGETSLKDDDNVSPAQLSSAVDPRPGVLGQVTLPLGDEGDTNLSLNIDAFFDPDAVRSGVSANYTLLADAELTLGAGARFGPEPTVGVVNVSIKTFF